MTARAWMRDATGAIDLYAPATGTGTIPEHPHPDADHRAHPSGAALHPAADHPIVDYLDWCTTHGATPDCPVDGDATARVKYLQCWDDYHRRTGKQYSTGSEPCEEPSCPHDRPHIAGQWFSARWPRFRDIAHVLYPGGVVPVEVRADDPESDDDAPVTDASPTRDEPDQLDLLDHLSTL